MYTFEPPLRFGACSTETINDIPGPLEILLQNSGTHAAGVETTISQSFSCILVHPFHVGDLWNDAPIVVVYRPLRIAPATDVRRALVSFPGKVQCDASRAL